MGILRGNRGKVTTKASAFLLSCSPEQLLLAPVVALALSLLPARGALRHTFVCIAALILDLKTTA